MDGRFDPASGNRVRLSTHGKGQTMKKPRKYTTFEEFERDEYLRVKSFYENLEDLMEEDLFSHYEDPFVMDEAAKDKVLRDLDQ